MTPLNTHSQARAGKGRPQQPWSLELQEGLSWRDHLDPKAAPSCRTRTLPAPLPAFSDQNPPPGRAGSRPPRCGACPRGAWGGSAGFPRCFWLGGLKGLYTLMEPNHDSPPTCIFINTCKWPGFGVKDKKDTYCTVNKETALSRGGPLGSVVSSPQAGTRPSAPPCIRLSSTPHLDGEELGLAGDGAELDHEGEENAIPLKACPRFIRQAVWLSPAVILCACERWGGVFECMAVSVCAHKRSLFNIHIQYKYSSFRIVFKRYFWGGYFLSEPLFIWTLRWKESAMCANLKESMYCSFFKYWIFFLNKHKICGGCISRSERRQQMDACIYIYMLRCIHSCADGLEHLQLSSCKNRTALHSCRYCSCFAHSLSVTPDFSAIAVQSLLVLCNKAPLLSPQSELCSVMITILSQKVPICCSSVNFTSNTLLLSVIYGIQYILFSRFFGSFGCSVFISEARGNVQEQ
nr:PREDICTED: uncharacterized protein LOC107075702 [Lepisosteus oculatus]